jgi:branched-chain amino acid transport system ATP-binding protein
MLFENLSVRENVRIGALLAGTTESPDAVLEFVGLTEFADETASSLPYGRARTLAIAIALATNPKLILLDEPAAGLNRQEADQLGTLLRKLSREAAKSCWVIEHDMHFLMSLVDHVYVMDSGRLIAQGSPDEVRASPIVRQRYLGG